MREILKKGYMLTDEHIHLARETVSYPVPPIRLLPIFIDVTNLDGFSPVRNESIQIHHVDRNHWVVSTSIGQTVSIFVSKLVENSVP